MELLIKKIEQWAEDRGLVDRNLSKKQYLKFIEEAGETARAILKVDRPEIIDGIGVITVCLIVLAKQLGQKIDVPEVSKGYDKERYTANIFRLLFIYTSADYIPGNILETISDLAKSQGCDLEDCLRCAWEDIKDRKGKLINGTFVKES